MKKRKSNRKVFWIFGILFVTYAIFMNMTKESSELQDSEDVESTIVSYEKQEIDLQKLEQYPFGESLKSVLRELEIDDVVGAVCEVDNSYGMTLRLTTNTKRLWVAIDDYFEEIREVVWIKDYDSKETMYYYIAESLNYNEPIYSYKTGEIIIDKVDGASARYPLVVSVDQLVSEVNNDISIAAEKYNNKWLRITGEVQYISDGGSIIGYYLYGTPGSEGIKVTCWIDEGINSLDIGEKVTFVGLLREITLVNNIEIAECEVVK